MRGEPFWRAPPLEAAEGEQFFNCRPKPALPLQRGSAGRLERRPLKADEGEQFFNCRPKPALPLQQSSTGRLERRPLRAAEGEQFFNCRPKPALPLQRRNAGRLLQRAVLPHYYNIYTKKTPARRPGLDGGGKRDIIKKRRILVLCMPCAEGFFRRMQAEINSASKSEEDAG